ncbi:hypothetical protein DFP72DRAFT_1171814 [Ephemerocybe angulata]|uniref:Carbonic anhydrase n=1 Tax=Ephemerocybe angulata TaxID=980116 RepID=A0A8H6M2Q7_9AGAR|nr:hypothetical protein DFP72DRAFT_1171814 [Tulosesus angulatus]
MITARSIANTFEEGGVSLNAVLTYAVGTLKVTHVVMMGHYRCGGVAASMAPLREGYAERWLGHTTLPALPSCPLSSPSSSASSVFSSSPHSTTSSSIVLDAFPEFIYETSGLPELRERVQRLLSSISTSAFTSTSTSTSAGASEWTRERIAQLMMGGGDEASVRAMEREGGRWRGRAGDGEGVRAMERECGRWRGSAGDGEGVRAMEREGGVGEVKLHDSAFRALVEENVKANVWKLGRSRVIREVS